MKVKLPFSIRYKIGTTSSGHHGHRGRRGHVGGSLPDDSTQAILTSVFGPPTRTPEEEQAHQEYLATRRERRARRQKIVADYRRGIYSLEEVMAMNELSDRNLSRMSGMTVQEIQRYRANLQARDNQLNELARQANEQQNTRGFESLNSTEQDEVDYLIASGQTDEFIANSYNLTVADVAARRVQEFGTGENPPYEASHRGFADEHNGYTAAAFERSVRSLSEEQRTNLDLEILHNNPTEEIANDFLITAEAVEFRRWQLQQRWRNHEPYVMSDIARAVAADELSYISDQALTELDGNIRIGADINDIAEEFGLSTDSVALRREQLERLTGDGARTLRLSNRTVTSSDNRIVEEQPVPRNQLVGEVWWQDRAKDPILADYDSKFRSKVTDPDAARRYIEQFEIVNHDPDEFKHPLMFLEKSFNYEDEDGGVRSVVDQFGLDVSGNMWAKGNMYDKSGTHAGYFTRQFYFNDKDDLNIHHDYFRLFDQYQSSGFGSKFYQHAESMYKKFGVRRVHLLANLSVGGYAWARMGFDFISRGDLTIYIERIVDAWDARYGTLFPYILRHAWDVAAVVGPDGFKLGKDILIGESWSGEKFLTDDSEHFKIGNFYYQSKKAVKSN